MKGSLKDACQRRPTDNKTTRSANYLTYLDTMNENLNKNIEQNVFPHWRNHNSLKGKRNLKFETHWL